MKNRSILLKKGQKAVAQYMRRAGYQLYDCIESEDGGYIAEYNRTAAGITIDTIMVWFNKNWKCVKTA